MDRVNERRRQPDLEFGVGEVSGCDSPSAIRTVRFSLGTLTVLGYEAASPNRYPLCSE